MAKTLLRWILGIVCILIALVFVEQVLGLLFIQRIAERAADPETEVRVVPYSVRFVGAVAGRLHQEVLDEPLTPDGKNWPAGFRWFFALEVIGLTGMAIAFAQIAAGLFGKQLKWWMEARTILASSILTGIAGVLILKMIPPRSVVTPPPSKVYDVEFMSKIAERPVREFPIDDLGPSTVLPEFEIPPEDETNNVESDEN